MTVANNDIHGDVIIVDIISTHHKAMQHSSEIMC